MVGFIRAYLRASTNEQDANRAKESLIDFAEKQQLKICNFYVENKSGATLERPELNRLLDDCVSGDILLVEDIDRLSRLNAQDWSCLKNTIKQKNVKVVALNVPTSWVCLNSDKDTFDSRMLDAINDMLIDMLASIARRDYEQRRQRQAQGIEIAKAKGKFAGRKKNISLYKSINKLLNSGHTYKEIIEILGCSSTTISRATKWGKSK